MLILGKVIEIADRKPDFKYNDGNRGANSCYYTKGPNGSGCIVGCAIAELYPHLKERMEFLDLEKGEMEVEDFIAELKLKSSTLEMENLYRIQNAQDYGNAWGQCITQEQRSLVEGSESSEGVDDTRSTELREQLV